MTNSKLLVVIIVVAITAGIMLAVKGTLQIGGVKVNEYHKAGILGVGRFLNPQQAQASDTSKQRLSLGFGGLRPSMFCSGALALPA